MVLNIKLSFIQLFSLLVSFGSQISIAHQIGPGLSLDLFFFSLGITSVVIGSVGIAGTYFIPAYIHQNSRNKSNAHVAAGECVFSIIIATIFTVIFLMLLLGIGTLNLEQFNVQNVNCILFLACLISFFSVMVTALSAIGSAWDKVLLSICLASVPQFCIIISLKFVFEPGVISLLLAQLTGVFIQFVLLFYYLRPYWTLSGIKVKNVSLLLKKMPINVIGVFCFSGYALIDSLLAPRLGIGVLSHQSFGQRLVIAFGSVISTGPFLLASRFSFNMEIKGSRLEFWNYLRRVAYFFLLITLLAALLFPIFGHLFIQLLFQHGNFKVADTKALTNVVSLLLIGCGPMLTVTVFFRFLQKLNLYFEISFLSLFWISLYLISCFVYAAFFQENVLSLSYSTAWFLTFLLVYFRAKHILLQ